MDTPAPINLSLPEAENQKATKHPRVPGFEVTCHVESIKKIREHELPRLEAIMMVGIPFTLELRVTSASKSFDL